MRIPCFELKEDPFPGVQLRRTNAGVVEVIAGDDVGLARGLGFAHAHDRLLQMELVRLVAQGRLAECTQASAETVAVDTFARDIAFHRCARKDVGNLTPAARRIVEAYCDGVNAYLSRYLPPLELLLLRHQPDPWSTADVLATVLVMSYVGLAQSQLDAEKLIVQAVHGGASPQKLKALFAPHLFELDDEAVEQLRSVRLAQGLLPAEVRFLSAVPKLVASNNWVVAPARSKSGGCLSANDPHLEVNRLPGIWYEWVGLLPDDYRAGISMPGVPGLVMGRTSSVACSFTYGFMDMVDYFVEEVRGQAARRPRGDEKVVERTEKLLRKGDTPLELRFRETSLGTLEADPAAPLADGRYLARAWSLSSGGAAGSANGLAQAMTARTAFEAQQALQQVTISCNWLVADRHGNIAYQQSGKLPRRAHGGLCPQPGWKDGVGWSGFVPTGELAHEENPREGFLASANEDRNRPGFPQAINLPMADYRARRIRELLEARDRHDLEDMKLIQRDLYSRQAALFLRQWNPYLPQTSAANELRAWNLRYEGSSLGAPLFERAYRALLREVFGAGLFGLEAWDALVAESSLLADYAGLFDGHLLGEDPTFWFGGKAATLRRVLGRALPEGFVPKPWGDENQVVLSHLLFGGKLPRWLGFDRGPVVLEGGRATIVQAQVFRAHGRTTTFYPSYRCVTDLSTNELHTALAGGPSASRFSPGYVNDFERLLRNEYKRLSGR